jgi:hypothetical protein
VGDLSRPSRGRRVALSLAVLVGLLAAVAIASTGDTPVGGGGVRSPSDRLSDVVVSLLLVAVAAGAPLVVLLLFFRRHAQAELERVGLARKRGPVATLVALGIVVVLLVLWLTIAPGRDGEQAQQPPPVVRTPTTTTAAGGEDEPYSPRFATAAVLVVLGIAGAAGAAAYLSHRSRRRRLGGGRAELREALADVLAETLDDLRAEPDPRRAVIAAYARLERSLAAYGLPRRQSDAPEEYLARVLGDLEVGTRSVQRLTDLFAQAKFSQHDVGPATKEEAIAALETVREELRAAQARDEAERAAAAARGQAAAL